MVRDCRAVLEQRPQPRSVASHTFLLPFIFMGDIATYRSQLSLGDPSPPQQQKLLCQRSWCWVCGLSAAFSSSLEVV